MTSGNPARRLYLVRHGLSAVDPDLPAHEWLLDPTGLPAIDALRDSGLIPLDAIWFSSPEAKAFQTARRLTGREVTVAPDLREHERNTSHWFEDAADFRDAVRRAFEAPDGVAFPGWEPLAVTRDRLVPAVRRILAQHPEEEVVLAGHGTAWTVLVAELTGSVPDLDAWAALRMPDLWVVEVP